MLENPSLIGQTRKVWLISGDDFDMLNKGYISANTDEGDRRLNDQEIGWYNTLVSQGSVEKQFHTRFFTNGDSREPELAGIWGAAVGSFYTLVVTLILSFPIGVLAAIYLGRTIAAGLFIMMPITPTSVLVFSVSMGALWLATVPLTSGLVFSGLRFTLMSCTCRGRPRLLVV